MQVGEYGRLKEQLLAQEELQVKSNTTINEFPSHHGIA
jgi:hypothetical protein